MKLVIQNTAHVWGGNEKMLATLGDGLRHRGHSVVISCARGVVSDRLTSMELPVTQVRPHALDPVNGLRFAAWLRRQRADALLITSWNSMAWAAYAGRFARVRRNVLRQGIVRTAPSGGIKRHALQHWIDDVITNAPEIRDHWINTAPYFPADRVHVVLNAVNPIAHRGGELRLRLRRELGVDDGVILVGVAGILARRKGFDLVLNALAGNRDSRVHLVVIGDGPARGELENLSRSFGLDSTTHFVGTRSSGAEAIGGLDVFVLSSHNEGMANVMLEAMSAGVPVIASEISGVKTAIGPTEDSPAAGWTFAAGDVQALSTTIREVVGLVQSQSLLVSARTAEALDRIRKWFSLDRMLDDSERILFG